VQRAWIKGVYSGGILLLAKTQYLTLTCYGAGIHKHLVETSCNLHIWGSL
jgi:hypothetical protein